MVLAVGAGCKYHACRNLSGTPETAFEIDGELAWSAFYSGNLVAVVHSHPDGAPPSRADINGADAGRFAYLVLSLDGRKRVGRVWWVAAPGSPLPWDGPWKPEMVHGRECHALDWPRA